LHIPYIKTRRRNAGGLFIYGSGNPILPWISLKRLKKEDWPPQFAGDAKIMTVNQTIGNHPIIKTLCKFNDIIEGIGSKPKKRERGRYS
jgi:hypothetical protein